MGTNRSLMRVKALLSCLLVAGLVQVSTAQVTAKQAPSLPSGTPFPTEPISDVVVSVHPTVRTVLVVTWFQEVAVPGGWLEFRINGGATQVSPERPLARGLNQELVLGAPGNAQVAVRVMNRLLPAPLPPVGSDVQLATNGGVPEGLPTPNSVSFDPAQALPAEFLLLSFNTQSESNGWALILDRAGGIVWYREPVDGNGLFYPRIARSGDHMVFDASTSWTGSTGPSTLRRVTIDNEVQEVIQVSGLHHSWDERDDGTVVWGSSVSLINGEELWEVDPLGNYRMIWDSATWEVGGNKASNTTMWEESSDTVLLTFWTNHSTVEVDFQTGQIVRQFGNVPGSWSFVPPESQYWFAHGVHYTKDHTLLVSTHPLPGTGSEQLIREYALDEANKRLVEIWSYGEGEGLWAPTWGEASRLDNGNTLLNTGSNPVIREVTTTGETVWEVKWQSPPVGQYVLGHMSFIDDVEGLYALGGG